MFSIENIARVELLERAYPGYTPVNPDFQPFAFAGGIYDGDTNRRGHNRRGQSI